MKKHLTNVFPNSKTPVTEPADSRQVENSTGGYTFKSDKWQVLDRFLILGTEGGSYYADEKKLTLSACKNLLDCIAEDGVKVTRRLCEVSDQGLAFKNDTAIFALAVVLSKGNLATKKYAKRVLSSVLRTGTHLYSLLEVIKANELRGFGRVLKDALSEWIFSHKPDTLLKKMTKYASRNGWEFRDVLRLVHPNPKLYGEADEKLWSVVFKYFTKGYSELKKSEKALIKYAGVLERLKESDCTAQEVLDAIKDWNVPIEVIPTEKLTDEVYEYLFFNNENITWTLRNLSALTRRNVLKVGSTNAIDRLRFLLSKDNLKKGRIHPLTILVAMKAYSFGKAIKGDTVWNVNQDVLDILDEAFRDSFVNVKPTGKKFVLGLDVSGSMDNPVSGQYPYISSDMCTGAFGLILKNVESHVTIMGFADTIRDLGIGKRDSIETAMAKVYDSNFGYTNPSALLEWAMSNKVEADCFVIMTDNEVNRGSHVHLKLKEYNKKMNRSAKMIVLATQVNDFTIAEPGNPLMLDICGFTPDFARIVTTFATM